MQAEFNGKLYHHWMIAQTQRDMLVSITALRMLQNSPSGNSMMGFGCFTCNEIAEAKSQAEIVAPQIIKIEG